jgi:hypothetical protein
MLLYNPHQTGTINTHYVYNDPQCKRNLRFLLTDEFELLSFSSPVIGIIQERDNTEAKSAITTCVTLSSTNLQTSE